MAKPNKRRPKKKLFPISLFLVLIVLACSVYAIIAFQDRLFSPTAEQADDGQQAKPWYKSHAQVPEMVRLPDTPLIVAAKEAEIDPEVKVIASPQKPSPRIAAIEPTAKPQPPVYEEALPQDIYTPILAVTKTKEKPVIAPETTLTPPAPSIEAIEKPSPAMHEAPKPRWMKFALKMTPPQNKPMIAVVIDDLGLDRKRTAKTLDLPGPITTAFIPYSRHLDQQTATARQKGHELLVHLPMEPLNAKIDAGPNHLETGMSAEILAKRLYWNLERFGGYVGVNNHMGSKATTDPKIMKALMAELRTRELLFLDSRTNAKSLGGKMAALEGVPFAERNVFLDNVNSKEDVLKQLNLLERVSRKTGYAVGIGHPRDATLAALSEWLPTIQNKGFVLVPISQIVLKNNGFS